jgi:5'(3')-deoxyribonucleotidase
MFILCNKLKYVKRELTDFNKKYFAKITAKRVEKVQCLMQRNHLDLEIHRAKPILFKEYVQLVEAEESFLRQKSWLQWLNLGDKNSKFFFNLEKSHHNCNKIISIHDESGMCFKDALTSFWGFPDLI